MRRALAVGTIGLTSMLGGCIVIGDNNNSNFGIGNKIYNYPPVSVPNSGHRSNARNVGAVERRFIESVSANDVRPEIYGNPCIIDDRREFVNEKDSFYVGEPIAFALHSNDLKQGGEVDFRVVDLRCENLMYSSKSRVENCGESVIVHKLPSGTLPGGPYEGRWTYEGKTIAKKRISVNNCN